jgi:hypothetical protein
MPGNGPPGAAIRVAAVLFIFNGVGFGLPVLPAVRNLIQHRDLPMIFGFRAYGGGFFEQRGIMTTIPLLIAFLVVNILEVVAGGLLWTGARSGAILGFALLPVGGIFWLGFALPFGPPMAIASSILVLLNWSDLH